jgi:hypothetical protein
MLQNIQIHINLSENEKTKRTNQYNGKKKNLDFIVLNIVLHWQLKGKSSYTKHKGHSLVLQAWILLTALYYTLIYTTLKRR